MTISPLVLGCARAALQGYTAAFAAAWTAVTGISATVPDQLPHVTIQILGAVAITSLAGAASGVSNYLRVPPTKAE